MIAMREMGVPEENIYIDRQSGKDFERPQYKRLLRQLGKNSVLFVKSIDRLGRSYRDLIEQWRVITDTKGADIVIIDIAEKSSFADYFVIATGGSERQLGALADDVEDKFAELEITPKSKDGRPDTGWILVDGGDVIVNLFTEATRDKYTLEKIWSDCESILVG